MGSSWLPMCLPWRWSGPRSGFVFISLVYLGEPSCLNPQKLPLAPTCRVVAGTLCQYYYTAGYLLMALVRALDLLTKVLDPDLDLDLAQVAYLLNWNWQLLQIVLTIPSLLFLSYWWVVPESVRWQISKVFFCTFFLGSFCNQEISRVSTLKRSNRSPRWPRGTRWSLTRGRWTT